MGEFFRACREKYFVTLSLLFVAVVAFMAWINFTLVGMYSTDHITEMDYARLVWETKSLFPAGWHFTTETYPFFPSIIASLFYGVSQDFMWSYAAAVIASALVLSSLIWVYLGILGVVRPVKLIGLSFFWTLYPDWLMMFDAFGYFYVEIFSVIILTLTTLASPGRGMRVAAYAAAFFSGFHSLRLFVMLYVPLVITSFIFSDKNARKGAVSLPLRLLATNLLGFAVMKTILEKAWDIHFRMSEIPPVATDFYGTLKGALGAFINAMGIYWQLLASPGAGAETYVIVGFYIMLAVLSISAAVWMWRTICGARHFSLTFFALSSLLTFCASVLLNTIAGRYYDSVVFFLLFSLIFAIDSCWASVSLKKTATVFSIFVTVTGMAIFWAGLSYMAAAEASGCDEDHIRAAQYIMSRGYRRAYATYWVAGPIEAHTNGRIETGYIKTDFTPFLWGTAEYLYAPYEEKVAVVLTDDEIEKLTPEAAEYLGGGQEVAVMGRYHIYHFDENPVLLMGR